MQLGSMGRGAGRMAGRGARPSAVGFRPGGLKLPPVVEPPGRWKVSPVVDPP